jgi:hypothetical protein
VSAARCATGKIAFADRETAAEDARRLRLRAYRCPLCGSWHLSSKPKVRARVVKRSPRECQAVWSL